ncbi:MAG TPA: hypothetical protein VD973_16380 [Symbiobacteriaceae bacterium]|nr:hypothetical protein [Symbiobacteriaceae bacterium]
MLKRLISLAVITAMLLVGVSSVMAGTEKDGPKWKGKVGSLMTATPELAIITNSMTADKVSVSDGDTVTWQTSTVFDNAEVFGLPLNPYTSNYSVKVNWDQFNAPSVTAAVGITSPTFGYVTYDSDIGGKAWVYNSPSTWFWQKVTWSMNFTTTVKNTSGVYTQYTRTNGHGQDGSMMLSGGPAAWVNTTWNP